MKPFSKFLHEMAGSYRQGFVSSAGEDLPSIRTGGTYEDHTEQARRLLGDGSIGAINKLLFKGWIRYWLRNGEIDFNYKAHNANAASNAVKFLKQVYTPGDEIWLDVEGAVMEPGEHNRYDSLGPAMRFIRKQGGLHVEEFDMLALTENFKSSIGIITHNGAIESEEYPESLTALSMGHESRFQPIVRASQRFRMRDGRVTWDEEPTKSDFFAVADYYANKGVPITTQYVMTNRIDDPADLVENEVLSVRSAIGQIMPSGEIRTKMFSDPETASQVMHRDEFGSQRPGWASFRYVDGRIIWDDTPVRHDYFAVENYFSRKGIRIAKQLGRGGYANVALDPDDLDESIQSSIGQVRGGHVTTKDFDDLKGASDHSHLFIFGYEAGAGERWRMANGIIDWDDTPSKDDMFRVADYYAKNGIEIHGHRLWYNKYWLHPEEMHESMKTFSEFLDEKYEVLFPALPDTHVTDLWYHGTSSICLPEIMQRGIDPRYSGRGAHAWATKHDLEILDPPAKAIYLTKMGHTAQRYAYLTADDRGGDAIILLIKLPQPWPTHEDPADSRGVYTSRRIPPEAIVKTVKLPPHPEWARGYADFMTQFS